MEATAPAGMLASDSPQGHEHRAACAEFPNDNPALHCGAIWYCAELEGAAVCERPALDPPMVLEEPAPRALEPATPLEPSVLDPDASVLDLDDCGDDIEIVDDLAFDDAIDESSPCPARNEPESHEARDPFAILVAILEEVALASGAGDEGLALLRVLVGRTRPGAAGAQDGPDQPPDATLRAQAHAWQGVLRGDTDDFGACGGAMLDEWCATLLARVVGNPARADGLKRELRRRGVAAFGIVDVAA
jgi:hypothetical protein